MSISLWGQNSNDEIWADKIEVINEQRINTENSEFSPVYWSDNIVFVKTNPRSKLLDKNTNEGYFDLFFTRSEAGYLPKSNHLSTTINTRYHEGPCTFSKESESILFTRVNYDGNEFTTDNEKVALLKIFESEYARGTWIEPKKSVLNLENVASCHPSLHPSGNLLIFSSDRPGGFGKMDLYIVYKTPDGWSEATNLGPEINSTGNDWFPFINERNFLYFASDGHSTNKDLDIYQCELEESVIKNLERLPYPINTRYDDFGLCIDKAGTSGYLSSNRPGGKGKDDIYNFNSIETLYAYGNDNYNVVYLTVSDSNLKKPLSKVLIKAQRIDETEVQSFDNQIFEINPNISIDTIYTGELGNAKINIAEGYTLIEITKDGKQTWKRVVSNQNINKNLIVKLLDIVEETKQEPEIIYIEKVVAPKEVINNVVIEEGSIIVFDNIYYDYNSYKLTKGAEKELDILAKIMLDNNNLKIQLSAHTDSRGENIYNQELSQKRAESAKNYLINKGIQRHNILAVGYGEAQLRNHCKDGVNCSEAEHIYNRRTEVKILQK